MEDFQEMYLGEILAINHDECTISGALNIKKSKIESFRNTIEKVINNHLNQEDSCKSALMADSLFACNPQSMLEVFLVGQMVGVAFSQLIDQGLID
jgi:hypothetical protein